MMVILHNISLFLYGGHLECRIELLELPKGDQILIVEGLAFQICKKQFVWYLNQGPPKLLPDY